jgi:hypothetical protein
VLPTITSFIIAISGLRVLRHLGVESVCCMTLDLPSPEEFPVSEVLESLSFKEMQGVKIVQWILSRRAPPPVTRIYLHVCDPEATEEAVVVVYKNPAKSLECHA